MEDIKKTSFLLEEDGKDIRLKYSGKKVDIAYMIACAIIDNELAGDVIQVGMIMAMMKKPGFLESFTRLMREEMEKDRTEGEGDNPSFTM